MKSKSSFFLIFMGVFGYFLGVIYSCTLILIPVAIYCFIGAKRYMDYSMLSDSQLSSLKPSLTRWAVFFSIFGFPIGLLSIFPPIFCGSNDVTISSVEDEKQEQSTVITNDGNVQVSIKREESKNETSDAETIEKLQHLYEEGLITKEELERAKAEINNK